MIEIYGASDDLIEVEGDIREEFVRDKDHDLLVLSNGVVLIIEYDRYGIWRINSLAGGKQVILDKNPDSDEDRYSDRAIIYDTIDWIVLGSMFVRSMSGGIDEEENDPQ